MAQLLSDYECELSEAHETPDLVFINTCCVTGRAEAKSRRFVGRVAKKYPKAKIIVAGCLAELKPEDLKSLSPNIDCLGTFAKDRLGLTDSLNDNNFANESGLRASDSKTFSLLPTPVTQHRSRAFLKIQDGCSQRCSYCIVPTTRGPSRSMGFDRALVDLAKLRTAGYPEIVLTGIHLGAYGRDLEPPETLDSFVFQTLDFLNGARLRLSSIEPQEVSDRLIEIMAQDPRICNHFHIPVQNLDDRILQSMGRPYKSGDIIELVHKIHTRVPDACLGADIMVGFPGEDEESFMSTVHLLSECEFSYLHVFPFSKRPGVPASLIKGAPDGKVVAERVQILRELSEKLRIIFYRRFVGRELEACLESGHETSAGAVSVRTDNYILADMESPCSPLSGRLFRIQIQSIKQGRVSARALPFG